MTALKSLLYVEDDDDIQMIGRLALENVGGFEVTIAGSGEEALALAENSRPDLILLDVMMPGMDGTTTLRQLRARSKTAAIPVIFVTAKAQAHEVEMLRKLGAIAVITKPFDPMTLADEIRHYWNAHHGH